MIFSTKKISRRRVKKSSLCRLSDSFLSNPDASKRQKINSPLYSLYTKKIQRAYDRSLQMHAKQSQKEIRSSLTLNRYFSMSHASEKHARDIHSPFQHGTTHVSAPGNSRARRARSVKRREHVPHDQLITSSAD